MAGNAEPGDRFGESVTVFRPCDGTLGVLVGVAGELSGEEPAGSGAVQTFRVSGSACKSLTIASETTAGLPSPPLGIEGSLTVLRDQPEFDSAEPVAAALAGGGIAVLRPPFAAIDEQFDLVGLPAAAQG